MTCPSDANLKKKKAFKKKSITLVNNQKFELDLDPEPGNEKRVFLPHPEIFKSVKKNTKVLIDDGKILLNIIYFLLIEALIKIIDSSILIFIFVLFQYLNNFLNLF